MPTFAFMTIENLLNCPSATSNTVFLKPEGRAFLSVGPHACAVRVGGPDPQETLSQRTDPGRSSPDTHPGGSQWRHELEAQAGRQGGEFEDNCDAGGYSLLCAVWGAGGR